MALPVGPGAHGMRGAAPPSTVKLLIILLTYGLHMLVAAVRGSPVDPWIAMINSVPENHGTDYGSLPIEQADPFKKTFDIIMIVTLVLLGGVFAGLTLGLMGLDMINLQVLMTSGSEQERKDATKVMHLLERGRHWVLVVLLLGNVIVNETLPIFLSEFGSGLSAVMISTILIVIFGEIVPQSICARHGLKIGAMCAPLVHVVMILLAPVAWPTAKLLDYCLGEEHGTTYRKAELKTFVSLHQQIGTENLNDDEVTIIRAVLDLNEKNLTDVMTPIEDVYKLPVDFVLDEEGVFELVKSGYSRVPIHDPQRPDAILGMLLVKQLIQYDPEDAWPISRFNLMPLPEASPDLNLLDAINYMQFGRSHMILVSQHPGEPSGAMGVVTLEDIIEEMIGEEIVDETDVFVDVHNKIKVVRQRSHQDKQEQWQPLIRGIIERRRKYGGPSQAPLHRSFGTMKEPQRSGQPRPHKYGIIPMTKARDKVWTKKPGSYRDYDSQSETSPYFQGKKSQASSSVASSTGFTDYGESLPPCSLHLSESEQRCEACGPYIVEMGGSQPRVLTVADVNEETARDLRVRSAVNNAAPSKEADPTQPPNEQ